MYNFKPKPTRSKKYGEFVKSLPSVVSGVEPAGDWHHVISCGLGGGWGTKASDLHTFPLTREEHTELHHDIEAWEEKYGSQLIHVAKTQGIAEAAGMIDA